tara:strand:+ start:1525 stop:1728 length:204 start_codon:yes stop_codon:yes gene_type:complete
MEFKYSTSTSKLLLILKKNILQKSLFEIISGYSFDAQCKRSLDNGYPSFQSPPSCQGYSGSEDPARD